MMAAKFRVWVAAASLLAGTACTAAGLSAWVRTARQNSAIAALAAGRALAVPPDAPDAVRLAEGLSLIAHGKSDTAQALADRMAASDSGTPRAALLYALGNANLRRGLVLIKTVPYRLAIPVLRLARADYRESLRLDPSNWDARYNYALVAPLLREAEAAQPSVGDQMAHGRAAWPDIPGAPNGMP